MATILVVDDEDGLRDMLCDALRIASYTAISAEDGVQALEILHSQPVDLIVADINMPHMDGFDLLKQIRGDKSDVPLILLTAQTDRNDVTKGLALGADDYVKKPFGLEELLLRISAVLRRTNANSQESVVFRCGPILLDDDTHSVKFNDELIEMSPTEFEVLKALMASKGKVVRKAALLRDVWGINFETTTNVVDTYVSYLRKKLHKDGYVGIKTIRGVGFQIDER